MTISIAICIYNDFDFIDECIDRAYDLADEIVILDGPYGYCKPILEFFDLYYSGLPEALRRISGLSKVRYEYGEFENEKSKRMALYDMCCSDVVMLLDSDELIIDINKDELEKFFHSDKKVACSSFSNLTRRDCLIGKPTRKYIFFKRQDIGAEEHLNYTWLVGVDQGKPNPELMYEPPVMDMAHLTLMRSPYFSMVKYCFYTRLYYYSRGMHDQLDKVFGLTFDTLSSKGLSADEVKNIFRRSIPALINFPAEAPLVKSTLPSIGARFDRVAAMTFLTDDQHVTVLTSVDSYHYLNIPKHLLSDDEVHFSFLMHDIEQIEVEVIVNSFTACTKPGVKLEQFASGEVHGSFVLPDNSASLFGTLIGFKAKCSEQGVGTITQFVIKRRFGIYGNCQTESLRDFLLSSDSFRRRYQFEETPGRLVHMMTEEDIREFHKRTYRVDWLITQPMSSTFGDSEYLGAEAILRRLRSDAKVLMLPNLFFTGYAPDSYCVSFRKKFLQEPMPVHDVNFIYGYLKHGGRREEVGEEYIGKLTDPDFYSAKLIRSHVQKNISELSAREFDSCEKFRGEQVRFYFYSKFVARWFDKALLHYSDEHPTEFVFGKLAREILEDLGLEDDILPVALGDKGVLPFYKSIATIFGLDVCSTPIYINDREVGFDEYFQRYCDAYDKLDKRELFGYISENVTKVVVTNDRAGTMLMRGIVREYCTKYHLRLLELNHHLSGNNNQVDPAFDFQHYDFIFVSDAKHFEKLVDAVPNLRYRTVHLIINPYEIILSGVRYHQVTDDDWCNRKLFVADEKAYCGFRRVAAYDVAEGGQVGDHTYREVMNELSDADKIAFEIRNHASTLGTIISIEQFLKRFRDDGNVTSIRLEDIGTDECVAHVFKFMALNEEFVASYRSEVGNKEWHGRHMTDQDREEMFQSVFDDTLYDLFASEFGSSIIRDFGYASDSPIAEYFVNYIKSES
jgi:hypothetical protein